VEAEAFDRESPRVVESAFDLERVSVADVEVVSDRESPVQRDSFAFDRESPVVEGDSNRCAEAAAPLAGGIGESACEVVEERESFALECECQRESEEIGSARREFVPEREIESERELLLELDEFGPALKQQTGENVVESPNPARRGASAKDA
jgi:hypothetical protein